MYISFITRLLYTPYPFFSSRLPHRFHRSARPLAVPTAHPPAQLLPSSPTATRLSIASARPTAARLLCGPSPLTSRAVTAGSSRASLLLYSRCRARHYSLELHRAVVFEARLRRSSRTTHRWSTRRGLGVKTTGETKEPRGATIWGSSSTE